MATLSAKLRASEALFTDVEWEITNRDAQIAALKQQLKTSQAAVHQERTKRSQLEDEIVDMEERLSAAQQDVAAQIAKARKKGSHHKFEETSSRQKAIIHPHLLAKQPVLAQVKKRPQSRSAVQFSQQQIDAATRAALGAYWKGWPPYQA